MTVKKHRAGLSCLSLVSVVASLAISQHASAHGHKLIPDAVISRYFVARGGADDDKPNGNSTLADATPNEESIDGDASDSLKKDVKGLVKEEDEIETSIESIDVADDADSAVADDADSAVGRVDDDVADGASSAVNDGTDAVDDEEIVVEKTRAKKKRASSAARKTKKKGRSRRSQETTTAPNNDATAVTDASSSKETSSKETSTPPPPPNALFRFLLRKGVAGHTVVMLLVTLWEFADRYLPRFVSVARWTLTRLRLYDPDATPPSRGAIGERDGASSGRRAVDARYGAFVDARRGTRSARGAQRKRSDLAALSKLRSLATKGTTTGGVDAKYGYCSTSFLERRGLGRFASAAKSRRPSSRDDDVNVDSEGTYPSFRSEHDDVESSTSATAATNTAAPSSDVVNDEDEESDAEWVVRALVDGRNDDDSKRRRVVSDLDDDAKSLLRKSDLSLLLRSGDRFRPTKSKSGRGSSKDVPSTVVRSLLRKTISGHNTRILGAYPNDAVDVEDAGDANGVVALAKRYGYGDWSSKGSSSSSSSSRRTPKEESKQKKKNPFFQFDVSFSADLSSGTSSARLSTKRRGRTSPSSLKRRKREERSSDLADNDHVLNVSSASSPPTTKRVRKQRIRRVKRDANKSTGVGVVKRTVDDVFPPSKKNKADSSSSSSSSSPFGRSLKDRLGEHGTEAAFVRKKRSFASDDPSVATTTTTRPSRTTTPSLPLQRVRELRKQQQDKDQS